MWYTPIYSKNRLAACRINSYYLKECWKRSVFFSVQNKFSHILHVLRFRTQTLWIIFMQLLWKFKLLSVESATVLCDFHHKLK